MRIAWATWPASEQGRATLFDRAWDFDRSGANRAMRQRVANHSNDTTHLSSADLTRLRRKLEHKRDALLASERDAVESARGVSDDSIEDGDVAERMIEQDAALRQRTIDDALIADIEHALRKLEAGTYGFSEDSGAPIELERLETLPWARRTTEEEQRHARRDLRDAKE